ncbi:MAG: flagellar basal body-associated FliL family protein [Verrucomicrobia bacterium]|nr:flagellar basal body-associated FliL family protein [Verrucomicrobiota bacterium]
MAAPASDKNDGSKTESSGGIKALLPLILNIVLLPVIAFAMTQYVILPRLNSAAAAAAPAEGDGHDKDSAGAGDASHGNKQADPSGHSPTPGKGDHSSEGGGHGGAMETTEMLESVTVNVAGTMGSRLLMAKIGVRGNNPKLKEIVAARAPDLRDAASSLLYTKTLMDIERQGARITIKAELKNAFQRILGPGVFTDVVMPEMAVQ